ncbi:hypothetical protein [Paraburkholderia sediminicola]|uniref:hypothetical protein n=1 Tax=Paraburkholderia sediminicola TaxID=458836 RepID=UPI0038BAE7F1
MRILILVLVVASICCPSIRHDLRLESINAFAAGHGSGPTGVVDDLSGSASRAHYASGFRPIVAADFHYGFGGLLAATSGLYTDYVDYIDVIDAATTLPIMQLAVAERRK